MSIGSTTCDGAGLCGERELPRNRVGLKFIFEVCCSGFSPISRFLEGILMENIDMKNSLESKLYFKYTFSNEIFITLIVTSKIAPTYRPATQIGRSRRCRTQRHIWRVFGLSLRVLFWHIEKFDQLTVDHFSHFFCYLVF